MSDKRRGPRTRRHARAQLKRNLLPPAHHWGSPWNKPAATTNVNPHIVPSIPSYPRGRRPTPSERETEPERDRRTSTASTTHSIAANSDNSDDRAAIAWERTRRLAKQFDNAPADVDRFNAREYQRLRRDACRNNDAQLIPLIRLAFQQQGERIFKPTGPLGRGMFGQVYKVVMPFPSMHCASRWQNPTRVIAKKEALKESQMGAEMIRTMVAWALRKHNSLYAVQPILFYTYKFALYGDEPLTTARAQQCCAKVHGEFVQSLIPGVTLHDFMRTIKPLPCAQQIIFHIALVLVTMTHALFDVAIHGDLNAGNIMVNSLDNDFTTDPRAWRYCTIVQNGKPYTLPVRLYIIDYAQFVVKKVVTSIPETRVFRELCAANENFCDILPDNRAELRWWRSICDLFPDVLKLFAHNPWSTQDVLHICQQLVGPMPFPTPTQNTTIVHEPL